MRKVWPCIRLSLGHSFSQNIFHTKISAQENITDCVYENFPLPAIGDLPPWIISQPGVSKGGSNVTIPYKELIIPYLDLKNEVVNKTGAW